MKDKKTIEIDEFEIVVLTSDISSSIQTLEQASQKDSSLAQMLSYGIHRRRELLKKLQTLSRNENSCN